MRSCTHSTNQHHLSYDLAAALCQGLGYTWGPKNLFPILDGEIPDVRAHIVFIPVTSTSIPGLAWSRAGPMIVEWLCARRRTWHILTPWSWGWMASLWGHDVAGNLLLIYNEVPKSANRNRGHNLLLHYLIQLHAPEHEKKDRWYDALQGVMCPESLEWSTLPTLLASMQGLGDIELLY